MFDSAMDAIDHTAFKRETIADLRTDHAGETGAVWIYRGVLQVAKDPELRAFATAHRATEQRHLELIEAVLPPNRRSILTPIWRMMGWITGAAPALFGPRAVYATIDAVETFVDKHYQEQIDRLSAESEDGVLRALLEACQQDEIHHRDEARAKAGAQWPLVLQVWTRMVRTGSIAAVSVARRI